MKEIISKIVYFDTETTGIRVDDTTGNLFAGLAGYVRATGGAVFQFVDLISIGAILDGTKEMFHETVRPPDVYMAQSANWWKGNTVSVSAVEDSPSAWVVIKRFVSWLKSVEATHLVAHNVAFDCKVLIDSYAKCVGASWGEITSGDLLHIPLLDSRDVLKEANRSKQSLHGPGCGKSCDGGKLTHLAHSNQLGPYGEHDALEDVKVLNKVCDALLEKGWESNVEPYKYRNFSR